MLNPLLVSPSNFFSTAPLAGQAKRMLPAASGCGAGAAAEAAAAAGAAATATPGVVCVAPGTGSDAAAAGAEAPVTISIGATMLQTFDDFLTAYDRADQALYEAKEKGRNGYVAKEGRAENNSDQK